MPILAGNIIGVFKRNEDAKKLLNLVNGYQNTLKYPIKFRFLEDLTNEEFEYYLDYFTGTNKEKKIKIENTQSEKDIVNSIFTVKILKKYKKKLFSKNEIDIIETKRKEINEEGYIVEQRNTIFRFFSILNVWLDMLNTLSIIDYKLKKRDYRNRKQPKRIKKPKKTYLQRKMKEDEDRLKDIYTYYTKYKQVIEENDRRRKEVEGVLQGEGEQ